MPIFQGGRVPHRFVKRNILLRRQRRQGDAVDGDRILCRVGALPEDGCLAVYGHPALTNPLFRCPAGRQSRRGNQRLYAHHPGTPLSVLQPKNALDFHRGVQRQRIDADRRSGMAARCPKYVLEQLGRPV